MNIRLGSISDKEFHILNESVLRLLSEYGVLFEHEEAQVMLKKAGMRVDENGRTYISPRFVESMLSLVPKDGFCMYGRDESKTMQVAADMISFRPSTGAPFILDYETKTRRYATIQDAEKASTIVDALSGYEMVNSVFSPREAPAGYGNVLRFVNSHRYSLKPSDITVVTESEVLGIVRIASAIRGGEKALRERPLTAVDIAMISPLRCPKDEVDAFIACAKHGLPIEVLTSPALGITGPITFAGSAALSLAEMIAVLCLVYLIEPGLGIIMTSRLAPTNLRTVNSNYGAPELAMGSIIVAECCARYHFPSNLYGFGTCAKSVGDQAEMVNMFSGVVLALGKPHVVTGSGMLDNGLTHSLEQLLIDNEAIRFIKRIRREMTISEETIGIDALKKGMKSTGTLLAEEHTLKYMREEGEMLDCGLNQWVNSYTQWEDEGKPSLYDRAHEKVEEILCSHHVEAFDRLLENEINRILEDIESNFTK